MFRWIDRYLARRHAFKMALAANPCLYGHKYEAVYNTHLGEYKDTMPSAFHGKTSNVYHIQTILENSRSKTRTYVCHACTRCGKKINQA